MKLFISWSGELSRQVAEELRKWFPAVLQNVKPYFTPSDIEKGARWNSDISQELEESQFGVFCLTRENLAAPWVLFEAGAISKQVGSSNVAPILFEISPADISGPLSQFQATRFEREDFLKLIRAINDKTGSSSLDEETLSSVFDKWWPDLEAKISSITSSYSPESKENLRSDRDILQEILEHVRMAGRQASSPSLAIFNEGDGEQRMGIFTSMTPEGQPYATRTVWKDITKLLTPRLEKDSGGKDEPPSKES